VQLDEVVHADRLLACELEQVIGHTVVAALLVQLVAPLNFLDGRGTNHAAVNCSHVIAEFAPYG
jgi:hypothetical protein